MPRRILITEAHERPLRRDGIVIETIYIAFAISIVVHLVALFAFLPQMKHFLSPETADEGKGRGSLMVKLAPPPKAKPTPQPAQPPQPAQQTPPPSPPPAPKPPPPQVARPTPAPPRKPAPPQVAMTRPQGPGLPSPPPAPASPPSAPSQPMDLSSYIEAQRRARTPSTEPFSQAPPPPPQPAQPVEDENTRRDRIIAANLGAQNTQTFGYDPTRGGGVFQITSMMTNDATFIFYGWNKDIKRNTKQTIEVHRVNEPDIRVAVVRKMIAIIRDHEQGDFTWISHRLGREITLSARPQDNAGLEAFLLQEFFTPPRQ